MSLAPESKDPISPLQTQGGVCMDESLIPSCASPEAFMLRLGRRSFTEDEGVLREHSETIARYPSYLQAYVDAVLASRAVHDDPEKDRIITTVAANAISILNYGSRSGLFPFHFIDVRDWSGIRVPYANLNYAMLAHCNLNHADLSGSTLFNATFFKTQLRYTNLTGVRTQRREVPTRSRNLVVHPRGDMAASINSNRTIRIFNIETDEDICCLQGSTSTIRCLDFSRDGSLLGSISNDKTVRIWDMSTYECISILQLDPSNYLDDPPHVAFSPDNTRFAAVFGRDMVGIGNIKTSGWITTFNHEAVANIDWHPSANRILSYTSQGDMCVWDIDTGLCLVRCCLENVNQDECYAKFTLDGSKIVVMIKDEVSIFDAITGACIVSFPKEYTDTLKFAQDRQYLYLPEDKWVGVYDLETHAFLRRFFGPVTSLYLAVTAAGPKLITYYRGSPHINIYDAVSLESCVPTVANENPWYFSFAFSPDNRQLVAGYFGEEGDLRFLDIATGRCIETVYAACRNTETYQLEYSPDGRFVAYVPHLDLGIEVYDVKQRKHLIRLEKHVASVSCITFSPQGNLLASSAMDCDYDDENGKILLWHTDTWQCRELRGHPSEVEQMCFSPDGDLLASLSTTGMIRLWDVATDACIRTIGNKSSWMSYSPCGRFLATADYARRYIRIWNVATGKCISSFSEADPSDTMCGEIAFLRNGRLISINGAYRIFDIFTGQRAKLPIKPTSTKLTISSDRGVMISKASQDAKSVSYLWTFPEDSFKVKTILQNLTKRNMTSVAQLDGSIAVASAFDQDTSIYIHNSLTGELINKFQGHTDLVTCTDASSDGRCLISGSRDHSLRLWDLEGGSCTAILDGHMGGVTCVQISPDNQFIASGSYDMTLRLWSLGECKCIGQFEGHTTPLKRLKLSPDNKHIASIGSNDHAIRIWDINTQSCSMMLDRHTDEIFDIQFSPDGHYLVSGSQDDTIRIWEMKSGECTTELKGHRDCLTCFVLSADGRTIVSGSEDTTIRVWDVATGECRLIIHGHTGHIRSLCLTPDNRCIISASNDHVIHIWDMITGAMLHQLLGHTGSITLVKLLHFDPDNDSVLVSTSSDGTLRLWTVHKMPSSCPYLPEMRGIVGAQETMNFTGADLDGAAMDKPFSELTSYYREKVSDDDEEGGIIREHLDSEGCPDEADGVDEDEDEDGHEDEEGLEDVLQANAEGGDEHLEE